LFTGAKIGVFEIEMKKQVIIFRKTWLLLGFFVLLQQNDSTHIPNVNQEVV